MKLFNTRCWLVLPLICACSASTLAAELLVNGPGLIAGGPLTVIGANDGSIHILHNHQVIISDAGLNVTFEDSFPLYDVISEPTFTNGVWTRRFSAGEQTIAALSVSVVSNTVRFRVTFEGQPETGLENLRMVFRLPTPLFAGKQYRADSKQGSYPLTVGEQFLEGDFKRFEIDLNDAMMNYRFDSDQPMLLNDGRAFDSSLFALEILVPLETNGSAEITLSLPTSEAPPNPQAIRFSHLGYIASAPKTAVLEIDERDVFGDLSVQVERQDIDGVVETVQSGNFVTLHNACGHRYATYDFSSVATPGTYRLRGATDTTDWFRVDDKLFAGQWFNTIDQFIPLQMCHIAVDLGDGKMAHAAGHLDDGTRVAPFFPGVDNYTAYEADQTPFAAGEQIESSTGGWHDAGDYDVNVAAVAYVTHWLALAQEEFNPGRDRYSVDPAARTLTFQANGIPDVVEQVAWGVRWLLSMLQDDGLVYVGVVAQPERYPLLRVPTETTDNQPGTGDEREVYVDYHSDDNLKFIVAMAAASRVLTGVDDALARQAWQGAVAAWDFFKSRPEVYRPSAYFSGDASIPGREGMVLAAAIELYLSDPQQRFLDEVIAMSALLNDYPVDYPWPFQSDHPNFWFAPPFFARLALALPAGSLKTSLLMAVTRAANARRESATRLPFPLSCGEFSFGESGRFAAQANDAYFFAKAVPEAISMSDVLPGLYWLYGQHPLNDLSFLQGAGFGEARFEHNRILFQNFNAGPATIPGSIIPGINSYDRAPLYFFQDLHDAISSTEAGIHDAAEWVFSINAIDRTFNTGSQPPMIDPGAIAGLWFDPDLEGEGYNIIVNQQVIVVFYYGYSATGERLWLVSEALSLPNDLSQALTLNMLEAKGGTFDAPLPSGESAIPWGTLTVRFNGEKTGKLMLSGNDGMKTAVIVKLAGIAGLGEPSGPGQSASGLAGLWFDPSLEGEGYSLITAANAGVLFFYGYSSSGERLWLISEPIAGTIKPGVTLNFRFFDVTGGTFDLPRPSGEAIRDWGVGQLRFDSCDRGEITLDGLDGQKTSKVIKLSGIVGASCATEP